MNARPSWPHLVQGLRKRIFTQKVTSCTGGLVLLSGLMTPTLQEAEAGKS